MNFRRKMLVLILAGMLVLLSACSSGDNDVSKAYNEAMNALKQGKYTEAADKLSAISFYEDSIQLSQYCRAQALAVEGKYEDAAAILSSLGEYRDAAACAAYYLARKAEAAAETPSSRAWAAALFEQDILRGFRDASARSVTIRSLLYEEGVAGEQEENWSAAAEIYSALGSYLDSADRCAYAYGRICEADGEKKPQSYVLAGSWYESANNYSDSSERAKQCLTSALQKAEQMIQNEDFDGAEALYLALGDRCDKTRMEKLGKAREVAAEKRHQEAVAAADALLESGQYDEARKAYLDLEENGKADIAWYRKAEALEADGKPLMASSVYMSVLNCLDSREKHYQIGVSLIETDPKAASKILLEDRKYSDTEDKLYAIAVQASSVKDFPFAISIYSELGSTRDCRLLMANDLYLYGRLLLEQKQGAAAADVFDRLGNVGSAELYANMARYTAAEQLENNGSYQAAAAAYDQISTYSDAADRAIKCRYAFGKEQMQNQEYGNAAATFQALGTYEDAASLEKECRYRLAEDYAKKNQWQNAIDLYTALGEYSDSAVQLKACYSALGEKQLAKGEAEAAYQSFVSGENMDGQAKAALAAADGKTTEMKLEDALKWYVLASALPETEAKTAMIAETLLNMEEDELAEKYASVVNGSEKAREVLYALAIRSLERQDEDAAMRQMKKAGDKADASERFREMLNNRVSALVSQGMYDEAASLCASFGEQEQAESLLKEKAEKEEQERQRAAAEAEAASRKAAEENAAEKQKKIEEANALLEKEEYENAAKIFTDIGETELAENAMARKAAIEKAELEKRYQEGKALTKNDPEKAYQILAENLEYQDTKAVLYALADQESKAENYSLSSAIFSLLSRQPLDPADPKADCIMRTTQDLYQYGLKLKEQGEYELAAAIFEKLSGLSLAQEHANEAYYAIAEALEQGGKYSQAALAFEALGQFSDAAGRAKQNRYATAKKQFDDGKYTEALKAFEALGEYQDAGTMAKECRYQAALKQMQDGQYEEAGKAFASLGDYLDASTYQKECRYQAACKQMDDKQYEAALTGFANLKEYKDTVDRLKACYEALGDRETEKADTLLKKGETASAAGHYITAHTDYVNGSFSEKAEAAALMTASCYQAVSDLANAFEWYGKAGESGKTHMVNIALYLVNTEQFEAAEALQKRIGTEESLSILYLIAKKQLAAGKRDEALRLFERAGDYSDAKYCHDEIYYEDANELLVKQSYQEAVELFCLIPEHRDAEKKLREAKLGYADQLIYQLKYEEAIEILESLGAYHRADALREKMIIPGGSFFFGQYEQDNDPENGTEAIEWIIMDIKDGKCLLLSKYGLDRMPYNEDLENTTWETSSLRLWLNQQFMATAFSDDEKQAVLTTTVKNDIDEENQFGSEDGGSDTEDKVFQFSYHEAFELFFTESEARVMHLTEYAKAKKIYQKNNSGDWWLRSPGRKNHYAMFVNVNGECKDTYVNDNYIFIRPAMWIDLQMMRELQEKNRKITLPFGNTLEPEIIIGLEATSSLSPEWKSSDESVCIIDSNEQIQAVGAGECEITATLKNGDVISVRIYVPVFDTPQLTREVTKKEGLLIPVELHGVSPQNISHQASDDSHFLYYFDLEGIHIFPIAEGIATITLTSLLDSSDQTIITVNVNETAVYQEGEEVPLHAYVVIDQYYVSPGDEMTVRYYIAGGTEPYTIQCRNHGRGEKYHESTDVDLGNQTSGEITVKANKEGDHAYISLNIVDAAGNEITAMSNNVKKETLEFVLEDQYLTVRKDSEFTLNYSISGGSGQYNIEAMTSESSNDGAYYVLENQNQTSSSKGSFTMTAGRGKEMVLIFDVNDQNNNDLIYHDYTRMITVTDQLTLKASFDKPRYKAGDPVTVYFQCDEGDINELSRVFVFLPNNDEKNLYRGSIEPKINKENDHQWSISFIPEYAGEITMNIVFNNLPERSLGMKVLPE